MKQVKRSPSLLLCLCLALSLAACSGNSTSSPSPSATTTAPDMQTTPVATPESTPEATPDPVDIQVGVLKGPTGIGAAYLMDAVNAGQAGYSQYKITLGGAPTEFGPMLISGELDIAAIPTNLAATLYNRTEGGITLLALNTLGVLYILENGDSVQSMSDLAGKTIYATGQGSNPEYVLHYLLRCNGLEPGEDVTIEWRDSDELSTLMAAGEIDLCMLPVPAATAVQIRNADVRAAIDLSAEWDALGLDSSLVMGCVAVRTEFYEAHPEAVAQFMADYRDSVERVMAETDTQALGSLLAELEIVGNAAIGAAALPDCNLCYIDGAEMERVISGYYQVLFDSDPSSIGGALPGADFYCQTSFGD